MDDPKLKLSAASAPECKWQFMNVFSAVLYIVEWSFYALSSNKIKEKVYKVFKNTGIDKLVNSSIECKIIRPFIWDQSQLGNHNSFLKKTKIYMLCFTDSTFIVQYKIKLSNGIKSDIYFYFYFVCLRTCIYRIALAMMLHFYSTWGLPEPRYFENYLFWIRLWPYSWFQSPIRLLINNIWLYLAQLFPDRLKFLNRFKLWLPLELILVT